MKAINTPLAAEFPVAELQKALETFEMGGVRGKIGVIIES